MSFLRRTGAAPARVCLPLWLGILGCLPVAPLQGQAKQLAQTSSLSEKSPFLPPGYGEKKTEPPPPPPARRSGPISQQLEVRGVMQLGNQFQFSVFHKKKNKSYWIDDGETVEQISVRNYDPASRSVTVMMNGRSERLSLTSASENPLAVATSTPTNTAKPQGIRKQNKSKNNDERRRVVPRRRVILPNK